MRLAQHVVVGVVGRGHFQTACSELDVYIAVFDDGDDTPHERYDNFASFQPLVLRVFGIDAHSGIAHDGLWTCRSDNGVIAVVIFVDDVTFCRVCCNTVATNGTVLIGYIIFQVIEVAFLFVVDDLLVGECRLSLRIPVHHAQSAVDESFVIEVNEHFDDALASLLVHRERRAVPVAACTQSAQLFQDDAAMFVSPVPRMLEELFTRKVALLDALLGKFLHYLRLGSDAGMVGSRHPAGVLAFHACTSDEDVLYCVVQHVSHVQHTRYVRWWYHHRVGLASVGVTTEEFVVKPILIPFGFYLFGVILCC